MQADPMHSSSAHRFPKRPSLIDEGRIVIEPDYSTGRSRMG